jgi:hypothetical protein
MDITAGSVNNVVVGIGVIVALLSILHAGRIARRRESASMLFTTRSDTKLQDGAKLLDSLFGQKNQPSIDSLANDKNSEEYRAVMYVLNHFESLSVGIQSGIYDEEMLKQCWCGLTICIYDQTHGLITKVRQGGRSTCYQEFEWLAKRWKEKPLKANRWRRIKRWL